MLVVDPARRSTRRPISLRHRPRRARRRRASGRSTVNASLQLSWKAGIRHRVRLINITPGDILSVALQTATGPVTWRPLTKDGAPVPPPLRGAAARRRLIGVGETYDFEYRGAARPPDAVARSAQSRRSLAIAGPDHHWLNRVANLT